MAGRVMRPRGSAGLVGRLLDPPYGPVTGARISNTSTAGASPV